MSRLDGEAGGEEDEEDDVEEGEHVVAHVVLAQRAGRRHPLDTDRHLKFGQLMSLCLFSVLFKLTVPH